MADPTSFLLSTSTPVSSTAFSQPTTLDLNTTNTHNSNSKTDEISHTDHVQGVAGKLIFKQNIRPKGEGTPADYSYVELSQLDGAYIKLMAGGMARMEGPNVLSLNSGSDTYFHTLQNRQDVVGLHQLTYVKGNHQFIVGPHDEEIRKYAEELQSINTTIAKTALDAALVEEEENIPCKVCNAKTEQKSKVHDTVTMFDQAAGWIASNMPTINFMLAPIMKILSSLVVFPNKIIKMAVGRDKKTKSCGTCKDGYIKGSRKTLDKMTKVRSDLIQQQTERINELHRKIGDGGNFVTSAAGDVYIGSGLVRNEAPAFLKKGTWNEPFYWTLPEPNTTTSLIYGSKGNTKRSIYQDPGSLNKGSMTLHAAEKFSVFAGTPGILAETQGEFTVRAGQLELRAAEGEAHFGSGNLTVINGNNVRIIGRGNEGDDGIKLEADNVHVQGSLHVSNALTVKGNVTMDGELHCDYINVPCMKAPVQTTEPSQTHSNVQSKTGTCAALRAAQAAKDAIVKWTFNIGEILLPRGMMNFIVNKYDLSVAATFIDMVPSGYHWWPVYAAPFLYNMPSPIYNYYHNHRMSNLDSRGEVAVPRGRYATTQGSARAARSNTAVPLASRSEGTFPSGGFGTEPGPCGGGNLFQKNLEQRNLQYGVDALDPFQGLNFIDRYSQNSNIVTAVSGNTGFLAPVVNPRFSLLTGSSQTSAFNTLDCN